MFLVPFQKKGWKIDHHVKNSWFSFSGGSGPPLRVDPLEKEINEIFGSKREDRLSDPFFEMVHNATLIRFSYLLRLCNFCKAPRDMRKFPQKCQKIAGC